MDICFGRITNILDLNNNSKFRIEISTGNSWFILISTGRKAQTGHNGMKYRPGKFSECFTSTKKPEESKLYVYRRFFRHVYYDLRDRKALIRALELKALVFVPSSAFLGNCYVQHAGAEYLFYYNHNLRYHVYSVYAGIKLRNTIDFTYDGSMSISKSLGFVQW